MNTYTSFPLSNSQIKLLFQTLILLRFWANLSIWALFGTFKVILPCFVIFIHEFLIFVFAFFSLHFENSNLGLWNTFIWLNLFFVQNSRFLLLVLLIFNFLFVIIVLFLRFGSQNINLLRRFFTLLPLSVVSSYQRKTLILWSHNFS